MPENITNSNRLEALNALFSLIAQADAESEEQDFDEPEQDIAEDEEPQTVVPVVATINSIIARNLKRLDESGAELAPADLITLAELSHIIQLPDNASNS